MTAILVLGGAGYIGSYKCKYLAPNGFNPIILDNFVHGHGTSSFQMDIERNGG